MATDILKKENIQILDGVYSWQEAIHASIVPLVQHGYVKDCYSDATINNVNELGAYFIIAPGVTMPHARPDQGVIKTQIGITLFRNPVGFDGKEKDVKLFVVLAAEDSNKHIEAMVMIAQALDDEEKIRKLCEADSIDRIYQLFV